MGTTDTSNSGGRGAYAIGAAGFTKFGFCEFLRTSGPVFHQRLTPSVSEAGPR